MNIAPVSVAENLTHAKAVLGGEISALINPADRAMIEHLHELILAADLQALERFVCQFSHNSEYLKLVANSAGKHFSQLVSGLCVNAHSPGVLLVNSYHGDFGLLIYASGRASHVVPIKTGWDGTIQIEHAMQKAPPLPNMILNNCATTARERLGRASASRAADDLLVAIEV